MAAHHDAHIAIESAFLSAAPPPSPALNAVPCALGLWRYSTSTCADRLSRLGRFSGLDSMVLQ